MSADEHVPVICPLCRKVEMGRPFVTKHLGLEGHPLGGVPMREATAGEVAAVSAAWAKRAAADRVQAVTPG